MDDNSYDAWQFERKPKPISAHVEAGEIVSNNISFDDYRSMRQIAGASPVYQRIKPPEWVFNNMLREVLLMYAENRLRLFDDGFTRTYEHRLHRIRGKTIELRKLKVKAIDRLCKLYVEKQNAGVSEGELRRMSVQIEGVDSDIRVPDAGVVETAAGVTYRYYNLREDSVAIGLALHLKPPAVRQILSRVRKLGEQCQVNHRIGRPGTGRPRNVRPCTSGKPQRRHVCPLCGTVFYTTRGYHKFCTPRCQKKFAIRRRREQRTARRAMLCPNCREQQRKALYQCTYQFTRR